MRQLLTIFFFVLNFVFAQQKAQYMAQLKTKKKSIRFGKCCRLWHSAEQAAMRKAIMS